VTRRRIARLRQLATKVRRRKPPPVPDRRTSEELERRLDETRERLRREIPPPDEG
jgi:glutamate synthase domain-containing protein 2